MQIDFTFTSCTVGIVLNVKCEKGDYPTSNIFHPVTTTITKISDLVSLIGGSVSQITIFPVNDVTARSWAAEIETEVKRQYKHWKEKQIPEDYVVEIT